MLTTTRCRMTPLGEKDFLEVSEVFKSVEVRQFLGGIKDNDAIDTCLKDMLKASDIDFYWCVRHRSTHEFIGLVSLDTHHDGISTELSYQFLPKWWGQGIATEVLSGVIDFARNELMHSKLVAETQTKNEAS
ncbi:MAG: GNAT family N-acetyltransferase, partial [Turicibacter sp.]